MDATSLQHLVQAGAVGISVALIFLIYKISERCAANSDKIIDVVAKNAEAMKGLKDSINKNSDVTDRMSASLSDISDVARTAMNIKKKMSKK